MERIAITKISDKEMELSARIVEQMGRDFAGLVGLDYDNLVVPALKNKAFWDVDYLEGEKWGLSMMDAYRCLVDKHRTLQIMGGIRETLSSMRKQGKEEIYAIDAGTGTGVFAIYLAALGVDKVFALELNVETAEAAEKFIAHYGFSDKVKVIIGDATKMNIPELQRRPADILVSENLSGGLFAEPQFQIINHLSKYLNEKAPIIPFSAELSVSLANGNWKEIEWNGKEPRNVIASRRIPRLTQLTEKVHYASVLSRPGMEVPRISGAITFNSETNTPVNTLLISTIFQINQSGKIYRLESDSAEFLGKTTAIELPQNAHFVGGKVNLKLLYDTGVTIKNRPGALTVTGSEIELKGLLS
jgi:predicted RNA methylase